MLAAGISPRCAPSLVLALPYSAHPSPLRHTRARPDPSYPRSPRVSRRAAHQTPFPPPTLRARLSVTPALAAGISPRCAPSPVPASHLCTHPLRHTRAKPAPSYPRKASPVIPAQGQPRHTRARPAPSYPRSPRVSRRAAHQAPFPPPTLRAPLSVTPAQNQIRHTRACRGYPAALRTKPRSRLPHSAPTLSVTPTQSQIRHTRARPDPSYPRSPRVSRRTAHQAPFPPPISARTLSVIPAQGQIRHTRARPDLSYPRSPRVSRRAAHQAPFSPPTLHTPLSVIPARAGMTERGGGCVRGVVCVRSVLALFWQE